MKKPCLLVRFFKYIFPWAGDSIGEVIRKIIFLIALIVFSISLSYLGSYFYQRYQSSKTAAEISETYYEETPTSSVSLPPGYQEKFLSLYAINPEIKGWISVPGTTVDYPVMQTDENNFYMNRDIYGQYDSSGTPFLDYRNIISTDEQSDNLIIYGHHMNFDGVFGVLVHYNDLAFYQEHPTITFDSVYKDMQWKVISGFYINTNPQHDNGYVFDYQNYIDLSDPERFNEYIEQITKRSVVQTNIDVQYGDKLLTLSTCANEFKDGRFVVVARLVRPGEDPIPDVSQAKYNPSTVYPEIWYQKFPNTPRPSEN